MIGATETEIADVGPRTDPSCPQTEEIFQVPKDTTPTWEVELLLSGALVFSMLQAPGLLDDAIYALRPRLIGSLNFGAFMLYFYLKITSYALIATFALHLFQRAIWVAGLGLRSVYPSGVDWDKLSRGPIYRDYAQRTTPTLDQMIDRADNRASVVFAFGMMLVLMSLAIMLFTLLLVVVGGVAGKWLPVGMDGIWLTTALVLVFTLPPMLERHGSTAAAVDAFAGIGLREYIEVSARPAPRLAVWRPLVRHHGVQSDPADLFQSPRRHAWKSVCARSALYSLMAIVMIEFMLRAGVLALPGESYLPEKSARVAKCATVSTPNRVASAMRWKGIPTFPQRSSAAPIYACSCPICRGASSP